MSAGIDNLGSTWGIKMVFVDRGLQLEGLRKSKVETFNLELGLGKGVKQAILFMTMWEFDQTKKGI